MADDYNTSISKSMIHFETLCKPALREIMGYEYMSIEGTMDDEHKRLLDVKAGIDIWAINEQGIRGMASRIQYGHSWRTFTVRVRRESGVDTELIKRRTGIEHDYVYPYYTMQAYINDDELLSMAVCTTIALFNKIDEGQFEIKKTGIDQIGQAEFYVVSWSDFDDTDIRIWEGKDGH